MPSGTRYYTYFKQPDGQIKPFASPNFSALKRFWQGNIDKKLPLTPTQIPRNVLEVYRKKNYTIWVLDDNGRTVQQISPKPKAAPIMIAPEPKAEVIPETLPEPKKSIFPGFDFFKLFKFPRLKIPGFSDDDDDETYGDELI